MQKIIHNLVNQYNKENGFKNIYLINKVELSIDISERIAKAFINTKEGQDFETKKAYRAFKRELIKQYRLIKEFIKIEYTEDNPYKNSIDMFKDIEENKRLKVFIGGEYHKTMKGINKIFRAVHDVFGHYINKNSFSFNGEYKAFLHHKQTFSKLAQKALFSETIAQNSFYRVFNQFSSQKTVILSDNILNLV